MKQTNKLSRYKIVHSLLNNILAVLAAGSIKFDESILKGHFYEISTWPSHALIVHRSNLNSFDTEIQLELSTLRNTVNYKPLTNTTTGRADKKSTDES